MSRIKTDKIYDEIKLLSDDEKIKLLDSLILDMDDKYSSSSRVSNKEEKIYDYLKGLKQLVEDSSFMEMYDYVMFHFNDLTIDRRMAIFKRLYVSVRDGLDRQRQDENEKYCKEHGHEFLDWEYIEGEHSHIKKHLFSGEDINGVNEYTSYWVRQCSRCGHKEISYINPNKKHTFKILKKK